MAAAFVGDFDNIRDVARELDGARQPFDPASPAQVLLAAFRAWGPETPGRMRGVFSGLVTDGRQLWAFRDHLGFQPLFYRDEPRGVFVATEIKQIVAGAGIPLEPDVEALANLFHLYVHSESDERRCGVHGVQRVPRAHVLTAGVGTPQVNRYWFPERCLETASFKPDEVGERFDRLMEQAVSRALHGDDVISLSGGIDSPTIAAYAAPVHEHRTGRPLPAITGLYPQFPSVDEERYTRPAAEAMNLPLSTYEALSRPTDGLLDWVRLLDGPVPVMSMGGIHENLCHARSLGCRNVLTGEFAEFVCDMGHFTLDYLLGTGRVAAALRYGRLQYGERWGPVHFSRRTLRAWLPPAVTALYHRMRERPTQRYVPWVDPSHDRVVRDFSSRETWRYDQLTAFEGAFPAIEGDSYVASVTGVGTRRPWTDVDLWEFFLSLPAEVKYPAPHRKALVRQLVRGRVPDLILDRRDKTVFDEAIMGWIDYDALDRWLLAPNHQVPGVRYDMLADRLRQRNLGLVEYMKAKDLAAVHAFLSLC